MPYREAVPGVPLITFFGKTLLALDADRGTKLWEQNIGDVVQRVVAAERTLFVAARTDEEHTGRIFVFDLYTGAPRGSLEVDFRIETALVSGSRIYFGGRRGLVALHADGTMLFRASPERMAETWRGAVLDVVMKDATGRESWRLPDVGSSHSDGLLVLGDAAAQPDFDH